MTSARRSTRPNGVGDDLLSDLSLFFSAGDDYEKHNESNGKARRWLV